MSNIDDILKKLNINDIDYDLVQMLKERIQKEKLKEKQNLVSM